MCGLNGILKYKGIGEIDHSAIKKMNDRLSHRGPDAENYFYDTKIALAHRRLSIIDLSDAGTQPMISFDGRYAMVYNGELYNYKELKFELMRAPYGSEQKPYPFRTNTDTEVILAAFTRWGKDCLNMFNGMFAFAIWDKEKQELFVARDRMGIKPLYYYKDEHSFVFSSEIRALLSSGIVPKNLSAEGLIDYFRYQTVHAPYTIIQDVMMMLPGHYMILKESGMETTQWWNASDAVKKEHTGEPDQIRMEVKRLFVSAVERRLVSDVPFGAFLSGGIDSSAVVAAMAEVSSGEINTFNVSFDETEFSESVYARLVSKKFGTRHHEIKLKPDDFLKDLPPALNSLDHPSGDGPNTYVVSKATKQAGITMALTGLGGDELFCGYDIFKRSYSLEKRWWLNLTPGFVRKTAGEIYKLKNKGVSGEKVAEVLSKPMINFEYSYPVSRKILNDEVIKGITRKADLPMNAVYKIVRSLSKTDKDHKLSLYSLAEMQTYMQNVLLRDADQMSMAVALELRVPFLDYKLVEFVLSLKDKEKYPTTPKKLLVDSLGDLLPHEIVNRPKMGFTFPWEKWMKNELKSYCEDKLNALKKREELSGEVIEALWQRFLKGDAKITWSRIWPLVVLGNWLEENNID